MKRLFAILLMLSIVSGTGFSQSRRETKAYGKVIKAPTAAACVKFLKKYPDSVYAHQIDSLRNDILYVSKITPAEAVDIAVSLVPSLAADNADQPFFTAVGFRDEGRDFIAGISLRADSFDSLCLYVFERVSGIWQMPRIKTFPRYSVSDGMDQSSVVSGLETVSLSLNRYLHFSYRNSSSASDRAEQVVSLVRFSCADADSDEAPVCVNAIFYGDRLSGRRIEGQCPELTMTAGMVGEETAFLLKRIGEDPLLVPLAREDILSDEAISWWLDNNPYAATTASGLSFGIIPEESSIVSAFKASRDRESSAGWKVALVDIRGYTVICALKDGRYSLVWCEPRCKDRTIDRNLSAVYFERKSLLNLFYYQGRRSFKYKINLSSKTITR